MEQITQAGAITRAVAGQARDIFNKHLKAAAEEAGLSFSGIGSISFRPEVLSFKVEVFKAGVNPLEVKADTMLLSMLKLKLGQPVKGMDGKSYAVAGTTPRGSLLIKGANGKTYKCRSDFLRAET